MPCGLAGLLKPRLDYSTSFCNFDRIQCGEACPTDAIARLAPAEMQAVKSMAATMRGGCKLTKFCEALRRELSNVKM